MTTTQLDDLAALRAIAEEGRRRPLLGGPHMILWGATILLATLFHWGVFTRLLPLPAISVAFGWFGLTALAAVVGRVALQPRLHAGAGPENRLERAVWTFGGSFIGLLAIALFIAAWTHHATTGDPSRFLFMAVLPPVAFGVYAIALNVSAEASGIAALRPYALAGLAIAAATAALAGSLWQFPVTALGALVVAILPGRLLVALERGHG
jgi:hypothetical protein